jgi:hypothetical protein
MPLQAQEVSTAVKEQEDDQEEESGGSSFWD